MLRLHIISLFVKEEREELLALLMQSVNNYATETCQTSNSLTPGLCNIMKASKIVLKPEFTPFFKLTITTIYVVTRTRMVVVFFMSYFCQR